MPAQAEVYEFRSVEIKQTAFRIDGVFIPSPKAKTEPIVFVEVQFQKDSSFYYRFFSEIMLYLRQYEPVNNWQAVVIYPSRKIESPEMPAYKDFLALPKVKRIYLNELEVTAERSLGLRMLKLVVESNRKTPKQARNLIAQVQQEVGDFLVRREIMELIETIVVYKFPQKSRQELEQMLGLGDLKETKFYQEAKQEGQQETKLEAVPRLLKMGLTFEQIAQGLDLSVEEVKKVAQQK